MEKIDFKKDLKHLYKPSPKTIVIVDVPEMNFIMIDGKGDPNTSKAFQNAVEALYGISYSLKFMIKKGAMAIDYGVMPLEGLWWAEDMSRFSVECKDDWLWTLMIMQPEFITASLFEQARQHVRKKKELVSLPYLRFSAYKEGGSAQIMHIGPFSEEGPTVEKIHRFIAEAGGKPSGKHHEIYLSDFRRTAPEKLKTIIRQPFR
jgi:hypothetical protein